MSALTIKKALLCTLTAMLTAATFALPGISPFTPDYSGEYVFYKDNSFRNTSYVGFLYYDDATYAARYYAPAAEQTHTPAKDITIYLSVNTDSQTVDFTGEKIIGASDDQDDMDIVNYLHDLFYEFTARRRNVTFTDGKKKDAAQDFMQFGGNVTITFNPLIPLFNVESITAPDKTVIFQTVTTGLLTSSADTSFISFKGAEGLPKDRARDFKKGRSAKATDAVLGSQKVTLDSTWSQSMENLWLLGDSALLTLNTITVPALFESSPEQFKTLLTRKLTQGTTQSFALWQQMSIKEQKNTIRITNVYYQPDTADVTRDFKILTDLGDGTYAYFTLTVFDGVYQKNRAYFDKIIKSYRTR